LRETVNERSFTDGTKRFSRFRKSGGIAICLFPLKRKKAPLDRGGQEL